MAQLKIGFLGHASFLFEADSGEKIFFDPWLAPENPMCKTSIDDVKEASVVCVTHGHSDHLGQAIDIVKKTGAVLIGSPEVCFYAHRQGIKYDEGSCPLNIGGSAKIGSVTYTMVPAVHSTSLAGAQYKVDRTPEPDGDVCGFVLNFDGTIVVYDSGDTGVFSDMGLISRLYNPQIAILPIGGKYTMGVREAGFAAHLLQTEVLIPCHYNTFPNQRADVEELRKQVALLSPRTKVVEIAPMASFTYTR